MEMHFKDVTKTDFNVSKLLAPLNKSERKLFMGMMWRIRQHGEDNELDITALSVFLIDSLHVDHTNELATSLTILVNKLVAPPFEGDRDVLKMVLEGIMKAVAEIEGKT